MVFDGTEFVVLGAGKTVATAPDGHTFTHLSGRGHFSGLTSSGEELVVIGSGGTISASANGGVDWSDHDLSHDAMFQATDGDLVVGFSWQRSCAWPVRQYHRHLL